MDRPHRRVNVRGLISRTARKIPLRQEAFFKSRRLFSGLFLAIVVASCASIPRPDGSYPLGYREKGRASWYGDEFQGRPTASGETYDMHGMTAAHRLIPLGTIVKVTHRENGRSVTVKVNDRGPFVRGRILDLSYAAADHLGMIPEGTASVVVEVVSLPQDSAASAKSLFTVQVGAFENKENARQLAEYLSRRYADVYLATVQSREKTFYRVRVGTLGQEQQADRLADRLSAENHLETFVIRKDP